MEVNGNKAVFSRGFVLVVGNVCCPRGEGVVQAVLKEGGREKENSRSGVKIVLKTLWRRFYVWTHAPVQSPPPDERDG